jgi:hypothetical protein
VTPGGKCTGVSAAGYRIGHVVSRLVAAKQLIASYANYKPPATQPEIPEIRILSAGRSQRRRHGNPST